jgi:hypothetical protein
MNEPKIDISKTNQLIDDLLEAVNVIKKYGWTRGSFITISPTSEQPVGVCIAGAIMMATVGLKQLKGNHGVKCQCLECDRKHAALDAVRNEICPIPYLSHPYTIPSWNDQPSRTKEEVISLLRRAAANAAISAIINNTVLA